MNRVFAPEPSIEVEIVDGPQATPAPAPATPAAAPKPPTPAVRHHDAPRPVAPVAPPASPSRRAQLAENPPQLLLAGFGALALALAGGTVAGLSIWNQNQQSLRQERNLLMIERLRSLAPGDSTPAQSQAPLANGTGPELPPPPPDEPWMQELSTLPQSSAPPARVLQVPMNDRVAAPAPAASGGSGSRAGASRSGAGAAGALPQLVGVIQIPGRSGSAIFQLNGSSTSAAVGDSIGSSGWRLRSAEGDSAVIERGGEQRRVTISSGS